MRDLVGVEAEIAKRLLQKAWLSQNNPSRRWEWLAGINANDHTLIRFRTNKWSDGVNLGTKIKRHLMQGGFVIIHHNHVTFHSLSGPDWLAMLDEPGIIENWVHCGDGTVYRGKIKENHREELSTYLSGGEASSPYKKAFQEWDDKVSSDSRMIDKKFEILTDNCAHFMNRELQRNGWVEYEYRFGKILKSIFNEWDDLAVQQHA